jgi:hypothetical protein
MYHCLLIPFHLCDEKSMMINEEVLADLKSAMLRGVTVGIGSQILIFENGVSILIQCPFMRDIRSKKQWGHGEEISTSVLFFDFFNNRVENALIEDGGILVLRFEGLGSLSIIPELNGLESYVVTTRFGIFPVAMI